MNNISKRQSTIIYVSAILLAVILAVVSWSVGNRPTNNISLKEYAASDVTCADGSTRHSESSNFGMLNKGDSVIVRVSLPEELKVPDSALCFAIYHSVTEVWWENKLLASYGKDIDSTGSMIGNAHIFAPIPDEAWGGELIVKLTATEENAFSRIKTLKIYPKMQAQDYYIDADPIGFFVSVPTLFISLIFIIIVLFSGIKNISLLHNIWPVIFALTTSVYIFTSDGFQRLLGFDSYFWTQLEFIAAIIMSYPLTVHVALSATDHRLKKSAYLLSAIDLLFFVTATVLHFTNALHYCALLNIAHALTILNALLMGVYVFFGNKANTLSSVLLRSGTIVLILCGIYEVARTSLPLLSSLSLKSNFHLGMLTMIICLILSGLLNILYKQKDTYRTVHQLTELRKMISTMPAGICQVIPDKSLTIVAANDLFYKIIGYRPEVLAANGEKDFFSRLSGNRKLLFDGSLENVVNAPDNTGEFEFTIIDKDDKQHAIMARYFHDREGSGNISATIIDITERKQMEEELRLNEERYKLALAQSGKVFFLFDVAKRTMFLSEELAQAFGLPLEVGNMPDNMIAEGLVEPQSVENYRNFYDRIYAGEPSGDTVISCHMRQAPETVLWYRIAFVSVFNNAGKPTSSVITYEDLQEERSRKIESAWRQLDIISMPESRYAIYEYELAAGVLIGHTGELFPMLPKEMHSYDEARRFVLEKYVHPGDVESFEKFTDRQRLLTLFGNGANDEKCEYRSLQEGKDYRWTVLHIQMIPAPYSGEALIRLLFRDINDEKIGTVKLHQSMEELKKELEQSRIRVMINQMQPHFLYNALASIQMITKRDPDLAYDLLHDFTVHLRSSIKALSSDDAIPFEEEIANIRAYLNIEKMRFGDKLSVNYEIGTEDFYVVPLTIQPLVENAVKHGVYPKGKAGGKVTVRSYETDSDYVVEVEDDGEGFDAKKVMKTGADSYGLKNLVFRLKSLLNADAVIRSEPGAGTLVTVIIPKNNEKRISQ